MGLERCELKLCCEVIGFLMFFFGNVEYIFICSIDEYYRIRLGWTSGWSKTFLFPLNFYRRDSNKSSSNVPLNNTCAAKCTKVVLEPSCQPEAIIVHLSSECIWRRASRRFKALGVNLFRGSWRKNVTGKNIHEDSQRGGGGEGREASRQQLFECKRRFFFLFGTRSQSLRLPTLILTHL